MISLLELFWQRVEALLRDRTFAWVMGGWLVVLLFHSATVLADPWQYRNPGLTLLGTVAWLAFAAITLAACTEIAWSVSREREHESVSLLLLAGITPIGLLLGLSASAFATVVVGLILSAPYAALGMTLGGVELGDVAAVLALLAGYLWLAAASAILASVVSRTTGAATVVAIALLGLLHTWPRWVPEIVRALAPAADRTGLDLEHFDLLHLLERKLDGSEAGLSVFGYLSWALPAGLLLFASACAWFHLRPVAPEGAGRVRFLSLARRSARSSRVPAHQAALAWKDWRVVAGGWRGQAVRLLLYGAIAGGALWYVRARGVLPGANLAWGLAFSGAFGGILESIRAGTRILRLEFQGGTWPVLFLLPIYLPRLIWLKALGALGGAAVPTAFLMAGLVLGPSSDSMLPILGTGPFGLLSFLFFAGLGFLVGLNLSLAPRGRAALATPGWTLLAWVMFMSGAWVAILVFFLPSYIELSKVIGRRLRARAAE